MPFKQYHYFIMYVCMYVCICVVILEYFVSWYLINVSDIVILSLYRILMKAKSWHCHRQRSSAENVRKKFAHTYTMQNQTDAAAGAARTTNHGAANFRKGAICCIQHILWQGKSFWRSQDTFWYSSRHLFLNKHEIKNILLQRTKAILNFPNINPKTFFRRL